MRRRMLLLAVLALTGCNRFAGPLESRQQGRADAPGYNIDEQKVRGRERLAIPEDEATPRTATPGLPR